MFCAHHAPAVLGRNRDGVIVDDLAQTITSAARRLLRPAQSSANRFEAGQETLEQELLLVRDVVIDRGFGDAQGGGNVVQRRVVIPTLVERPRCRADHRVTLGAVVLAPAPAAPRGSRVGGGRVRWSTVGHDGTG